MWAWPKDEYRKAKCKMTAQKQFQRKQRLFSVLAKKNWEKKEMEYIQR